MLLVAYSYTKADIPMKNIWYPDVAAATFGCNFRAIIVPIITVPDPTPKIPCTNPAKYPPKQTYLKFLFIEKSTLVSIPIFLYNLCLFDNFFLMIAI